MIRTLEGTDRYLVTRRIVPEGEANIFEAFPQQVRETISEVHYIDGSRRENKGQQGTYGIDLDRDWAARVSQATNLIDLINISEHGQGLWPEPNVDELLQESPLETTLEEREIAPIGDVAPRRWLPGITLNQGQEGSCVGHGCRHFVNGDPVMTDPRYGPSAVELYRWAQKNDPWPGEDYSGTSVAAGLQALINYGYIKSVGYTKSHDAFIRWLSEQGGLVIGADWYEGMHRTNAAGYITPTGRKTGGHCVWINELLPDLAGVGGQNSWGGSWGINGGFFKLSSEHLRSLMNSSVFVAGAVTQVGAVAPTPPGPTPPEPAPPKPAKPVWQLTGRWWEGRADGSLVYYPASNEQGSGAYKAYGWYENRVADSLDMIFHPPVK